MKNKMEILELDTITSIMKSLLISLISNLIGKKKVATFKYKKKEIIQT